MPDETLLTFGDMSVPTEKFMQPMIVNGKEGVVELRKLPYAEFLRYQRETARPVPPGEFNNDGTFVRDYDDQGYKDAVKDRMTMFGLKRCIASMSMEVPGDTDEDKVKAIQGNWQPEVINALIDSVNKLHAKDGATLSPPDTFQQIGVAGTASNGESASDP